SANAPTRASFPRATFVREAHQRDSSFQMDQPSDRTTHPFRRVRDNECISNADYGQPYIPFVRRGERLCPSSTQAKTNCATPAGRLLTLLTMGRGNGLACLAEPSRRPGR